MKFAGGARAGGYMQLNDGTSDGFAAVHRTVGFWSWPSAAAEPASKLAVSVKARNPNKK